MPTRLKAMVVAAALVLGSAAAVQMSGQAEALLQKAIQAETVDGDLKAAIALYEKAVAAAGSNRSLAAKALVQMGDCYDKMGHAGARKAYERVVRDYPDQASEVALARQKLAGLAEGARELASRPVFRKITIPGKISFEAQLSSDGSRLAFASGADIWVVDLHGKVAPDIAGQPGQSAQGHLRSTGIRWWAPEATH